MHIVCCVKQVPDAAQVKADPITGTLMRTGVESICNPYDLVAAEAAVQLCEKYGGGVTVVCMGPPQAESVLRQCLALGAREAVLLSDRAFAGADTLATSYTLAQAISRIASREQVDLVMCGKLAIDGDTGQTGPGIASRLGFNLFTYVSEVRAVDLEERTITVKREVEGGSEVVVGKLPALLTAELELATVRYASLPEVVRSLRQEIRVWGARELGGEPERLGLKGSPTAVRSIFAPQARRGGVVFDGGKPAVETVREFIDAFSRKERDLLEHLAQGKHAEEHQG